MNSLPKKNHLDLSLDLCEDRLVGAGDSALPHLLENLGSHQKRANDGAANQKVPNTAPTVVAHQRTDDQQPEASRDAAPAPQRRRCQRIEWVSLV